MTELGNNHGKRNERLVRMSLGACLFLSPPAAAPATALLRSTHIYAEVVSVADSRRLESLLAGDTGDWCVE